MFFFPMNRPFNAFFLGMISLCGFILSGCPADEETSSSTAPASLSLTYQQNVIPPGAVCAYGGAEIVSGVDTNGNGKIDAGEVQDRHTICNGADGSTGATGATGGVTLVNYDVLPIGDENCSQGGLRVRSGVDADGNELLTDDEVNSENFLCRLANGDFRFALAEEEDVATEDTDCSGGEGVRVRMGLDANSDNTLATTEVSQTEVFCDSEATVRPVRVTIDDIRSGDAAMAVCPEGGKLIIESYGDLAQLIVDGVSIPGVQDQIDPGGDKNRDGTIDVEGDTTEIARVRPVCNQRAPAVASADVTDIPAVDAEETADPPICAGDTLGGVHITYSGMGGGAASPITLCDDANGAALANIDDRDAAFDEGSGIACPTGGVIITVGIDADADETLDAGEVDIAKSAFTCDDAGEVVVFRNNLTNTDDASTAGLDESTITDRLLIAVDAEATDNTQCGITGGFLFKHQINGTGAETDVYVCHTAVPAAEATVLVNTFNDRDDALVVASRCVNGGIEVVGITAVDGETKHYLCNGFPSAAPTITKITAGDAESTANCDGRAGVKVETQGGVPVYVCDGEAGEDGGIGATPAVETIAAGSAESNTNCNGRAGVKITPVGTGTTPLYVCNGADGAAGTDGDDGAPGTPGTSPTVAIIAAGSAESNTNCDGLAGVKITPAGGGTPVYVCNGADGDKGDKGDTGADGDKGDKGDAGASPTIETVAAGPSDTNCGGRGGVKITPAGGGTAVYACNGASPTVASFAAGSDESNDNCGGLAGVKITPVGAGATPIYVCDGEDGDNGETPTIDTAAITDTDVCADGGTKITFDFTDNTKDRTVNLCNGEDGDDGETPTITPTVISAGAVCTNGGTAITFDFPTASDQTINVCNGEDGAAGTKGEDGDPGAAGETPTITTATITDTNVCAEGGTAITFDFTDNTKDRTVNLCNGADGDAGAAGSTVTVSTPAAVASPTGHCPDETTEYEYSITVDGSSETITYCKPD